jgi:hypothetical protein
MEDASASVGGGRHAATPPRSQRDPPPLAQSRRVGHRQDGHPARALIVSVGLRPGLPTGRWLALSLAISDKSTAVSRPDHTCQPTPIDPVAFPAEDDTRGSAVPQPAGLSSPRMLLRGAPSGLPPTRASCGPGSGRRGCAPRRRGRHGRRPRSAGAPRRSARSSTPRCGPARPASAATGLRPAPSASRNRKASSALLVMPGSGRRSGRAAASRPRARAGRHAARAARGRARAR